MAFSSSSGFPSNSSNLRQQLLARIAVVVEKARRNGRVLGVVAETDRLMGEYPNCPMSRTELEETITRLVKEGQSAQRPAAPLVGTKRR